MGAYLSSPVTGKELYEGAKEGYLEYGGASMQVIPAPRCSTFCSWRLWPLPPGAAMALANYPQRARAMCTAFLIHICRVSSSAWCAPVWRSLCWALWQLSAVFMRELWRLAVRLLYTQAFCCAEMRTSW